MAILVLHRETPRYIKENCEIETINIHESSNINYLLDDSAVPNTPQTLELNYLKLDGKKNKNVELINGAWSSDLSGADGVFENVPELIFTFTRKYSSNGLSLWFEKNIFCNDIEILCYNDDELIVSENIYPDSEYVYFEKQITDFNKIHLKFNSINTSNRRLRLFRIDFGRSYLFTDGNVAECNIFEEIDYYSTSYIENTASISIKDINHVFNRGDRVDVFQNGKEINSFVINQTKLISSDVRQLVCGDVVGDYQTIFTAEELVEFQDAMENDFADLQIRNNFKVKTRSEWLHKLRGTAPRTNPLGFLLLYAFVNHGFISVARGNVYINNINQEPKKIDFSRIKGEISTNNYYFYNSLKFKMTNPFSDNYYEPMFKYTTNNSTKRFPAPLTGETKIYQTVSGDYFYTYLEMESRTALGNQLTYLKGGVGWSMFYNPGVTFTTENEGLVYQTEYVSYYASEEEYEYSDELQIGDKLSLNVKMPSVLLNNDYDANDVFEAKKDLFLNKYTTTYSFYLILNDEVCGDTIQFKLKTGEEKTGVIQSISMNLQGNKNIAKIEVVCVE